MPKHLLPKRIIDNLSTAVIVLNSELVITYINPAAEIMFETSSKSICEQPISALFFENENTTNELKTALKTGHPFTKREVSIRCNTVSQEQGQQLTVNYFVSVIQEPGEPTLLLIEFQSLDRLLKISRDEALLSNQQATKALLRGMAHEVKNPLGGIKGAAQLLSRELKDNDQQEYIEVIISEADRLRNLVDRMLGPRTLPNIHAYNIHEILEHICNVSEASTEGRIEIIKDYDPSIPDVYVDQDQLIQAGLNIVGNACEALLESEQEKPRIMITTRILRQFTIASKRHRMVVKVDFTDNGPGIPEEIRETLFYPMVSGRAQGSGLGLSISQSIVNQFDGLIECSSEAGETTFSLLLPIEKPETEKPKTSKRT
jgi:two-component system nitrogen regulation sensor histidine kinase GlnL